jgi:hypothetical protein
MRRATEAVTMGHIAQRFGFHIGRGWVALILLGLAIALAAYWVGPMRPLPPELELLAIDESDRAVTELSVGAEFDEATSSLRFAVPLAVRNVGVQEGRPRRLVLSVPARYRVVTHRGRIAGEVTPGVPLRRYVIDLPADTLPPGGRPRPLAGLDRIWLEPDLPRYYCTTRGDAIPEFVPAPDYEAANIADVRIFYSFAVHDTRERSTGVLTVRVDPDRLQVSPAEMPPLFPTIFEEPETQRPDLGVIRFVGTRTAWCGDPEQPMELYTAVWEGAGGTRHYAIHVHGTARKLLYDMNGNGIIDLEVWDLDGDGYFEARREARYPVPEFLEPLPPRNPELAQPDMLPRDSAWLAVFANPNAGPFRFTQVSPPLTPSEYAAAEAAAAERAAAAAEREAALAAADTLPAGVPGVGPPTRTALQPLPPPDPEWLALFLDVNAGPFRFSPRRPAVAAPTPTTPTTPAAPGQPGVAAPAEPADTVEVDTVPEPPPAPRPAPRRVPLGTPVPRGG